MNQYVKDAAEMGVETQYVEVKFGEDVPTGFGQAQPAARTLIKLDGDSETIIPMRQGEDGLEIDDALFEVHERNVSVAIEYRAEMLTQFPNIWSNNTGLPPELTSPPTGGV